MKIAFLTPEYPHTKTGSAGGIGTSIKNLAQGLLALDHEVSVLVYKQKKDATFKEDGITFYQIKNVKCKGISWLLTQKKIEKLINSLYTQKKIDLIEAPDWTGITAFVQPKCPIILKLHGSDTYFCHLDDRPVKWFNRFLEKRAFKKANAIISVSQFTAETTKQLFESNKNVEVIPNGIDIHKFSNIDYNSTKNENIILYFGTLIRKKGALELPYIFNKVYAHNPKANLWLVGKDSFDIKTKIASTWELMKPLFDEKAFQNVAYKGSVPYEKMQELIQEANVCVFPTFAEALPVSWIEAMAMQKPVVASNIGWANEIIKNGENGFLVHPKEHNVFAQRINEVLQNKELQNKLASNGRKSIEEHFSNEIIANKSLAFYKKVIHEYY